MLNSLEGGSKIIFDVNANLISSKTGNFHSYFLAGNANFSDGGFVTFHASNTPAVRVSGCVKFGGLITVDTSQLPKGVSNITLMVFNCSTATFSQLVTTLQPNLFTKIELSFQCP